MLAIIGLLLGVSVVWHTSIEETPQADAATGVIDALNVGTCLATNADVFEDESCQLFNRSDDWEIRDEIREVGNLYATYAHDPKSGWDEPRAILEDSDLLKISISDPDRDRRSAVIIRGEGHSDIAGGLDAIKRLLIDHDLIDNDEDVDFEADAVVSIRGTDGVATVSLPGSQNFNFEGASSFRPMDIDGNIRFIGCATAAAVCVATGSGDDALTDVTRSLEVDEDRSSGSTDPTIAPWMAVNASVPVDKNIHVYAVYYETSGREEMIGDSTYYHCGRSDSEFPDRERGDVWRCGSREADERNTDGDIEFTDSEIDDNDDLLLRVRSDGDQSAVNLHLEETGRFTGRYEGYVRLTDANGDGSYSGNSSTDWGAKIRDASGGGESDAAVIGVAGGPVTIEYRDSGGRRRSLRVDVDYAPPQISIETPQHGTASDDFSPDFIGSFNDDDSGVAVDSFRLVVDNDGGSTGFALDGLAPKADVRGTGTGGSVRRREDYGGYSTSGDDPFGVIDPRRIYDLGDESCRDQDICHILSDDHRDGASSGRFDDTVRLRLDGDDQEFGVDFQAFVMDVAGNFGFSDAHPNEPYFINDLGTEERRERFVPNVLGYYSAHIFGIDEKDPEIVKTRSATGYYGLDSDDNPIADRRGVMLVFDGAISSASVDLDTFEVELDDGSAAEVVDVIVAEQYVFLKLAHELASDATPYVSIAAGQSVRDRAGNITSGRELRRFEANDGISPNLKVTLNNGSGTGEGTEGPGELTNGIINIHIESDEPLQGAPRVLVVCESLTWEESVRGRTVEYDIDDFIANRSGAFNGKPGETAGTEYTCGYDQDNDRDHDQFNLTEFTAYSRPGENWEVEWINARSGSTKLQDGRLRVVVFARDRSRHVRDGQYAQSWGAASSDFVLDTNLESPLTTRGGEIQPRDGSRNTESRPFIFIEFSESTTVSLDSVIFDGVEIASSFENPEVNRFVYWPQSMARGMHEVEVEATDAAGNAVEFDFEFESVRRGDFVLNLANGWNAISLPADPVDSDIEAVFTNRAIEAVIGWDTEGWRVSVRRDGVWESNQSHKTLPSIRARYGYWVKSSSFVRQRVALRGQSVRSDGTLPGLIDIPTEPGWNFVGVIDSDGDQTQDHFGITLADSRTNPVTASVYLGSDYVRAYTWDATFHRFEVLRPDDTMTIGDGVWVYYSDGSGIAP